MGVYYIGIDGNENSVPLHIATKAYINIMDILIFCRKKNKGIIN